MKMALSITVEKNFPSVKSQVINAECHFAQCRYAECHYPYCRDAFITDFFILLADACTENLMSSMA
jgi:hypothetical protein